MTRRPDRGLLGLTQLTPSNRLRPLYRADRRFVPIFATFSQSFINGMTPTGAIYTTWFENHGALWKALLTMLRRQRAVHHVSHILLEARILHLEGLLTLLVAAIAMLSSNGCQLICRIFLLKSI